jgi:two-component system CheB/CheR fusion protein
MKRPGKSRKPSLATARMAAGRLKGEASNVANDSRELFRSAHDVEEKSDEVHRAVDDLHRKIQDIHAQAANDSSDDADIVIEEKSRRPGTPFPIVGIGASAGGFEAFTEFLAHLPKSTGMAMVLVQHLDPKHKSKLTELLGHTTKIPVIEAHHDLAVEPDHIYVIPENANMTIAGGKLKLSERKARELPPMPIDTFLRSLAQEQENRAVGVVLSGTGTDGTLGLEAIKGEGGITFAQDETSSKYFGMPGSAFASGAVDFVMSPARIAAELGRISRHPFLGRAAVPQPKTAESEEVEKLLQESPESLGTLFNLLRARSGVDFTFYKQSTLKRRIIRRMVLHKLDILASYIKLLQTNPIELDALFNDLLINVTNFFRDPGTFQVLKKKIFPRIIKAHLGDSPLRMWVCGCATGQEAYSLAMTLVEFFQETHTHRLAQIFATDISDIGIERARSGIYPENILQDVSPERLRRFFTKVDGNYQIHKSIRDMCVFARQNVLVDPPFSNLDLITCRNVLIYFGPVLQRKIIPLFHYALRPEGFLMLGSSETIGPATEHFGLTDKKHKIYTKKATFMRAGFDLTRHTMKYPGKESPNGGEEAQNARHAKPADLQQQVDRILLRDFSPAAVVVNSSFEVVQFRGRTGDYLEHAPGTASLSLLKMARESLVMHLRSALTKSLKQDIPVKVSGAELKQNRHTREVSIEVVPFSLTPGPERFLLVAFKEAGAPALPDQAREARPASSVRKQREQHEISRLKNDLQTTKESLQSIIEEQEATNEELKSANEEIQSSNEELQSTNEELETAKEELQSTNEELTTLNEELQNRNGELSLANNDLTNLIASVNVAILMLGSDLTLRRFTPTAERLFNLIPSDVGRPLTDLSRSLFVPDLITLAREVVDNLITIERETQDRDGHWYLLRVRPYRTRENKIEGAVVMLVDIDTQRRAVDAVLSIMRTPMVILGNDYKVRNANDAFIETFKIERQKLNAQSIFEIGGSLFEKPQLRALFEESLPKNKRVTNFEFEDTFGALGQRKLCINARRFAEDPGGLEMIVLAMEDVTDTK